MSITQPSFNVLDNNPFSDDLFDWMASPEGILFEQVRELTWEMLEPVNVDATNRCLLWPDDQALTTEQSAHRINDTVEPGQGVNATLIEAEIHGWLETEYLPENLNEVEMNQFEELVTAWVADSAKTKSQRSG